MVKQKGLKNLLKRVKVNESTISAALGALVIIALGALIFNYFRGLNRTGQEVITKNEPTPQPTGTEQVIPAGLPTTYTVAEGDNLWKIAEKFYGSGYNWVDIVKENKLANPNVLIAGTSLSIPRTEVIKPVTATQTELAQAITGNQYTVVKGDNLWKIAVRAYSDGYKWVEIARSNNLSNPNIIHVGTVLTLPR